MKNKILITLCIFAGMLFIVSGISKLFPVEVFELTLVKAHVADWSYSGILARIIIAIELFLGFSLLQKNYIRQIILSAMILLALFSLHLAYTMFTMGNTGNCGCFGELIPMSPLAALIKNIVLLIMLDFVLIEYKGEPNGKWVLPAILFAFSFIAVFVLAPFQTVQKDIPVQKKQNNTIKSESTASTISDGRIVNNFPAGKKEELREAPAVHTQLPKAHSAFGDFHYFSDSVYVDLDSGVKVAALLSLDCEHCMDAAKKIVATKKKSGLPPVYFLYLGEQDQLKEFFAATGAGKIPYKILNARTFFSMLQDSPPRIVLLENGNIIGDWNSANFSDKALKEKLK